MRVIDFFCGAGGFSEGFRQMGYDILYGFDYWKPAVDTFNYNYNLNCARKNILDFYHNIEDIDNIPNSEIIIGSPPCVSFSSSNKSGYADKSLGVMLTETYLRVVAVKKHQPKSILKAWLMENVVNSRNYLQESYTFSDLGLSDWATLHKFNPSDVAIDLKENTVVINSANYGAFQARKRVFSGELIANNRLFIPDITHTVEGGNDLIPFRTIRDMKKNFPNPFDKYSDRLISDPQYPIEIRHSDITDHFYDTGAYYKEWMYSKYWKTNHPFMGVMSFPENENKPSRTITATKIANSRESIYYISEHKRAGDGEYRLPTVREAAIMMGYPITYQFLGTETHKWRLVGNSVCCAVSKSFASALLKSLSLPIPVKPLIITEVKTKGIPNLNSFELKSFDKQPQKTKGVRFRRHAFKDGNMTVTLSNYDILSNSLPTKNKWYTSIQYGTGRKFMTQMVDDYFFKSIESLISSFKDGPDFINYVSQNLSPSVGSADEMQHLYEIQTSSDIHREPSELISMVQDSINSLDIQSIEFVQYDRFIFNFKEKVPLKQLFALYAINYISSIANNYQICQ